MELNDRRKKRAANMVWTAAGRYDLEPMYLFYSDDGEPSLYLNTLEGLAFGCLDAEEIVPFLEGMECGREPDTFRTFALLAVEQLVFRRCQEERPALASLRQEYAEKHLRELGEPWRYRELSCERQEMILCCRILGRSDPDLPAREIELADALKKASELPEKELVEECKSVFWRSFYYKFTPSRKSETTEFVGAGLFIALITRLLTLRVKSSSGADQLTESMGGGAGKVRTIWKHMLSQTTETEDREFISRVFGINLFTDQQTERLEQDFCRDYHTGCHLWYAGAVSPDPAVGEEWEEQYAKNRSFFYADEKSYRRSIHRITEHLKHALEEQLEPDVVHTTGGRLDARKVYRIRAMRDLAVFRREIAYPSPDFTVDLVLDASDSRKTEQEAIAVQAYIITQSLMNLNIPVQVTAYRSMRGYTVLQRLKGYEETEPADGVFHYFTAGSNRDGLALTALRPLMEFSGEEKRRRIILVLTDALPADTQKAYVPGTLGRGKDYNDEIAVEDTRSAVQAFRADGTKVSAIFWGCRYAASNLKRIYGDSYVSIHAITQLPDAVIGLLLRILGQLRDQESGS